MAQNIFGALTHFDTPVLSIWVPFETFIYFLKFQQINWKPRPGLAPLSAPAADSPPVLSWQTAAGNLNGIRVCWR